MGFHPTPRETFEKVSSKLLTKNAYAFFRKGVKGQRPLCGFVGDAPLRVPQNGEVHLIIGGTPLIYQGFCNNGILFLRFNISSCITPYTCEVIQKIPTPTGKAAVNTAIITGITRNIIRC